MNLNRTGGVLHPFSFQVCLVRFFGRIKPTDKRRHATCADASTPTLATLQFGYAEQTSRFVTGMRALLVLNVACCRYISKVAKRVVSRVAVYVVNVAKRPISSHVKPSQSTGSVPSFIYPDDCVSFGFDVARNRPWDNFSACFYFPRKNASFGNVVQQCTQLVKCDVRMRHAISLS